MDGLADVRTHEGQGRSMDVTVLADLRTHEGLAAHALAALVLLQLLPTEGLLSPRTLLQLLAVGALLAYRAWLLRPTPAPTAVHGPLEDLDGDAQGAMQGAMLGDMLVLFRPWLTAHLVHTINVKLAAGSPLPPILQEPRLVELSLGRRAPALYNVRRLAPREGFNVYAVDLTLDSDGSARLRAVGMVRGGGGQRDCAQRSGAGFCAVTAPPQRPGACPRRQRHL